MPTGFCCCGKLEADLIGMGDKAPGYRPFGRRSSMAAGVVFGVSAGVILLHDLFRVSDGRCDEDELVAVKDHEEL